MRSRRRPDSNHRNFSPATTNCSHVSRVPLPEGGLQSLQGLQQIPNSWESGARVHRRLCQQQQRGEFHLLGRESHRNSGAISIQPGGGGLIHSSRKLPPRKCRQHSHLLGAFVCELYSASDGCVEWSDVTAAAEKCRFRRTALNIHTAEGRGGQRGGTKAFSSVTCLHRQMCCDRLCHGTEKSSGTTVFTKRHCQSSGTQARNATQMN